MRTFGLIGFPLSHSFSETYFSEKFFRENIQNCNYRNFPLERISYLNDLIKNTPDLAGLNVTIPYKESVLGSLDKLDENAAKIGAVNTIKIVHYGDTIITKGYNTDYLGFEISLKPLLNKHHKAALILGSGGASKAVKYVLNSLGLEYTVVSRTKSDTHSLTYNELNKEVIHSHQVIINTTPLGMHPDIDQAPDIPYELLSPEHLLYDLIYNPAKTLFLKNGAAQGTQTKNGLEMLYLQAEKAWEIWNE
jgi:shikimate dehydrogenase